ncbi:MAG TPA: DNA methyltransferase, partial [Gemmatimonadaceae bacterium]|nr:DNA methyltransferase [Gemmatimonadaceae bacterium]
FLSFLETQGWLNGDHGFLANGYADCMASGGRYHQRVLLPLFFGTLNTPPRSRSRRALAFGAVPFLNGGLFSKNSLERKTAGVRFPDESLGGLYGDLLCRHRFSPREDSTEWSEAAIDPEMLGKSFESLMVSADRKSTGAFYTPQSLVERVVREALTEALRGADMSDQQRLARVRALKVLDPACGSGAFLVFALSELTALTVACGDKRARGEITRSILVSSIFGVDINPMAVWLCELRLWLAMVMEQRHQGISAVTPLPNLDRQIRVGDTLAGGAFESSKCIDRRPISRVRARYTRSQGPRKRSLGRILDRAERALAVESVSAEIERNQHARRELVLQARALDLFGSRPRPSAETRRSLADLRATLRDLRRTRANLRAGSALPFSFATHFTDVAAEGGFGLVAGNPPWVRLHRIPPAMRVRLRAGFQVFRGSAWETGCQAAKAGPGFGSQVDVAALFTERSLDLLRPDGIAALLLPAKLWSSLAGGGVRALLADRSRILGLEDLTDAPASFDAAVYPSLLLARKTHAPSDASSALFAVHRRKTRFAWRAELQEIALDETTGSPWILAPPEVRAAFDNLRDCGVPLGQTRLGSPLLGVKSGCNEAFVITRMGDGVDSLSRIRSGDIAGEVETAMLRPAIRGEHIAAWLASRSTSHVVWTHGLDGNPLPSLPPRAKRWLHQYRARLEARADARATERWWSLFRTDGAASDRPRVIWADVGKRPRAAVLPAGDNAVPLNSCYVLKCRDDREALTLAAILNSDLAAAWLELLAEPARGGYHRYLGWTMAMLPLPRDWTGACAALPPIAERAMSGAADSRALLDAVLRAYGLRFADIAPLLAWTG